VASLQHVVGLLDVELRTADIPDYDSALNGLQLANSGSVTRIAAAVDFSGEVVDAAVAQGANLLLVHHGMFWHGAQALVGPAYRRLRAAVSGDLAVYSSHIPLDVHPVFGNNALLARELGLTSDGGFGVFRDLHVGLTGTANEPTSSIAERAKAFASRFDTTVVVTRHADNRKTSRWALVTGAGASSAFLQEAVQRGVDTLIVGEGNHHSAVDAMELGLVAIYMGHYATETLGVQAIARHVAERCGVSWTFLSAPTGR
jgi:dinuclear metal center YbgI/SA1388 family protein